MSKHTQGEWKRDGFYILTENKEAIARTFPMIDKSLDNGLDVEVAKANAHLIASAPELLEACKRTVSLLDLELKSAEYNKSDVNILVKTVERFLAETQEVVNKAENID